MATAGPIRLGGRAFDMLTTLIEASLAVVSKDALLAAPAREDRRSEPAARHEI